MDVKRVSQDSKRPGRTASDMGTPGGPSKLHDHEEGHDHDEHDEDEEPFVPSHGITSAEAAELLEKWGRNELTEHKKPMWLIVFELLINAAISFYETTKAGNAVAALKSSLKAKGTVKRDGKWQDIEAALLVPGDMVLLAAGSSIPADCWVNEGEIEVDQ
eukprot:3200612-Rhodomonas_salina.1